MFGVIPRDLWARHHPPDERGRIDLVARVLVARFGEPERIAVIDSGLGQDWSGPERDRYKIDPAVPGLTAGLASLGIDPDAVTDAVITHLHFDHAGGWVERDTAGRVAPALPRAVHHVQRAQWEWAERRAPRDRGSFVAERYAPLAAAGLLNLVDGDEQLFPGLEVLRQDGHTPGLQVPVLRGATGTVAFPADLLPTAAHHGGNWIMAYDLEPLVTFAEKQRFLERAAGAGWTLVLEHDPACEAARVTATADGFTLRPVACPAEL